jgi:hypothetical protein
VPVIDLMTFDLSCVLLYMQHIHGDLAGRAEKKEAKRKRDLASETALEFRGLHWRVAALRSRRPSTRWLLGCCRRGPYSQGGEAPEDEGGSAKQRRLPANISPPLSLGRGAQGPTFGEEERYGACLMLIRAMVTH